MNKLHLSALVLGLVVSFSAQSKLDLQSSAILRAERAQQKITKNARTKSITREFSIPASHITGMIKLSDGASASDLEAEGVTVLAQRGDIALVSMPTADVERLSDLDCVKKLELSREVSQKMDIVREIVGVDKIHAGTDLPKAYTGKGVATGIVDGGLDPNHINFKNEDGSPRIQYMTNIYTSSSSSAGYVIDEYYTQEKLEKFTTDDETAFHGTHTLGIMAGGYKGTGTFSKITNNRADVSEIANPYYGIAYESDIVASCGTLADMFIAYGIEGVLNYAYDTQKPAVINLSLGSNTGPHDGSDVMAQYLDLAAKEAIICVAAGNSGDIPIALTKTFTENDLDAKTFIYPIYEIENYYNLRYGQIYVYSEDATEFVIKAVIYNKSRGTITFQSPISANTNGEATYYASPDYLQDGDLSNINFTRAFNGYVGIGTMTDENSGRYYALIDFFTSDNQTYNANGNYILGFVVEGTAGKRVDCFIDGTYDYFDNYDQEGWDEGSANGSISDMACAKNIISVGSYNTRDTWASLDGAMYSYQGLYPAGKITPYSAYGTLIDGRNVPLVCAPGATTISSSSKYYIENTSGISNGYLQGKYEGTTRNSYWHQCAGTSMAAPVVAGSIALWLEADPTLTTDEVKDIIAQTAIVDDDVTSSGDSIQWGAGKFDAYAGLKEVIRRAEAGVGRIDSNNNRLMVTSADGRNYNVFLGGANHINVALYNIAGQNVANYSVNADEMDFDASGLPKGYYIINVNGTHSQRIIVK